MSAAPAPPLQRPSMAEIITAYELNRDEAEAVSCLLKGSDKLQNYWRARSVLERLCEQEAQKIQRVIV